MANRPVWDIYENDIYKFFYMKRGAHKYVIDNLCEKIWDVSPKMLVAIWLYTRSCRESDVAKGKGEKMIAYHMAFWIYNKDADMFLRNYNSFISLGCYRDCLVLAKMAILSQYDKDTIYTFLMPMAAALIIDTQNVIIDKTAKISMAAKWAPRRKKAFNMCIKYLKTLCCIEGRKSDEKWRKYIGTLMKYMPTTLETQLSAKDYDINFEQIPNAAHKLYKNLFQRHPKIKDKYQLYIDNKTPHSIIEPYTEFKIEKDEATENNWQKCVQRFTGMNGFHIPMIDVSQSMYDDMVGGVPMINYALSLGILLSEKNEGVFKNKAITFSSEPRIIQLTGCLYNKVNKLFRRYGSPYHTDFEKVYDALLRFIITYEVPNAIVKNIKIIALTDMDYASPDILPLSTSKYRYELCGYDLPQLMFWDLRKKKSLAFNIRPKNQTVRQIINQYVALVK